MYMFFFHICSSTVFLMFVSLEQLLMFKMLAFSRTQENIWPLLLPWAGKFGSHWHNHTPVHRRCNNVGLHKWCRQQGRGNWCSWRHLSDKHYKENQPNQCPLIMAVVCCRFSRKCLSSLFRIIQKFMNGIKFSDLEKESYTVNCFWRYCWCHSKTVLNILPSAHM